jgi:hypothetical protein
MNRLVIAPSILAADFGRTTTRPPFRTCVRTQWTGTGKVSSPLARRAQSLYCAIPATGRPTPSTEACLRKRRNKAIAPYGLFVVDYRSTQRVGRNRFIAPFLPRVGQPHRRKLAFENGAIRRLRPTALRCRLSFHLALNRCGVVTISTIANAPYAAVCFLGFGGLVWLCLLSRLSP